MLQIAVYDDNKTRIARLDAAFHYFAFHRNTQYEVSWFVGSEGLEKLEKYASGLHLAFVCVDAENNQTFCTRLNKANPNCRICYFSTSDTLSVDISNPLWFMDKKDETIVQKQEMVKKLGQVFNGFKYFGNLLIFDTRQLLYMIPIEDILYFQSDLKYVNIICKQAEDISIYKKLDEVEAALSDVFLRIHKSYIVNKTFISRIDKANRTVILNNGEELPVSNARYLKVLEELSF